MEYQLEILLSTYNGEQYLCEQIDSLLSQSFSNWRLLVRDDGSIDNSRDIIDGYMKSYPEKIVWLEDELGHVGASQSFSILISQSEASYVALCDQDDVWRADKLTLQMKKISEEENSLGRNHPLLINTDLLVTDQSLNVLSPSFWKYQKLNPSKMGGLRNLIVQNYITGCTLLMNRAMVNNISPIPKSAVMYDWWIALVAASKGTIVNIDVATVLYRQHEYNKIGAKKWDFIHSVKQFSRGATRCQYKLIKTKRQAKALLDSGLINGRSKLTVEKYVNMFDTGWIEKRKILRKEKFRKNGFARNAAMFFYI